MSYLKSKFLITAYKVLESSDVSNLSNSEILTCVNNHAIKEIQPDQESCYGWTSFEDLFKTDIDMEGLVFGDVVALGFRYDVKRIPSSLIKKRYRDLVLSRYPNIPINKIKKDLRKELMEECRAYILSKTLATPQFIHALYDRSSNKVYVDCKNDKMLDYFQLLFEDTFSAGITRDSYNLDEKLLGNFLNYIWGNLPELSVNLNEHLGVNVSEENKVTFNGPTFLDFIDNLEEIIKNETINSISLQQSKNENTDYFYNLNNETFSFGFSYAPRIRHESVETAIIDHLARINDAYVTIKNIADSFLEKELLATPKTNLENLA